jgi:hypothetical protein
VFCFADVTSMVLVKPGSLEALWDSSIGGTSSLASESAQGIGTYLPGQPPDNLFDGNIDTRYASRGSSNTTASNAYAGFNTGFYFTIAGCQTTLTRFRLAPGALTNADPTYIVIEGTTCVSALNCTSWTPLYSSVSGLGAVTNRSSFGDMISIASPRAFPSYRFTVAVKRGNSPYVSYGEVEFYGY